MKKQTFIKAIDAIEKQHMFDIEASKKLGFVFPNADTTNLIPDNHLISNALIMVLQDEMNDTELCEYGQSWIEYFCFELIFGKLKSLKSFDNGIEIDLSSAEKLYYFLKKRTKNKIKIITTEELTKLFNAIEIDDLIDFEKKQVSKEYPSIIVDGDIEIDITVLVENDLFDEIQMKNLDVDIHVWNKGSEEKFSLNVSNFLNQKEKLYNRLAKEYINRLT